ncbi:DUF2871 domain-containing protein [Lacticaseibacillus kribbianus]|uniref:DUF2871 domain-containing protein n=1 Tax=Lacticaseibacillus kribbianus TaxID=2926292 RepID=UPI001CD3D8EC|nr:DUF2871 domain-containing protein [Lacticaseibacillus kribbianus]
MRKIMNVSLIYLVAAMVAGVFYREFTKALNFTGPTVLGVVHTHLMALGVGVFALVAVAMLQAPALVDNKRFRIFFWLYNVAFPVMAITMAIRGVVQVTATELTGGASAALSGIAGLSHIGVAVALFLLLWAVKQTFVGEFAKRKARFN